MSLSKFDKDMKIIAALDDEPNDVGGISAAELKAKFDEGGEALKTYINDTLIPAIEELLGKKASNEDLQKVVLGQVADGSITLAKLADEFFEKYYSKNDAMTAEEIRAICT